MNNIALGRYIPLNSPIHRLDPRAKIISLILVMIAIFIPTGYIGYGIIGFFVIITVLLANLKLNFLWRSLKPMMFMLFFLLVINILVVKQGTLLLEFYQFKIYSEAIFQTLYIMIRLILMIFLTTILTATTKPLELTLGIEDLLKPFQKFRVPAHEIAMMISIALRFIPTLIEETQRIMKAQASRGVDFDNGKFIEKIKAMLSLIVPLFVSAFQRAEELAYAMEARGYIPNHPRTRYKQLSMRFVDQLLIGISFLLVVCMVILNVWIL